MDPQPPTLPDQSSTLPARMINILVTPGEVYDEVRDSTYKGENWHIPLFLAAAVALLFVLIAFAQPAVVENLLQTQEKAMDQQVASGKMTAAQAEAARGQLEQFRPMMATMARIFGGVGAVVGTFVFGFVAGFVLWLLARFTMGVPVGFWRCMELVGLSQTIGILGTILTMFVVIFRGSLNSNLSPAMLVPGVEEGSVGFSLLSALNPIYLWSMAVLALGLARLTGRSWGAAALRLFGVYGAISLAGTLLGWVIQR